MIFAGGIAGVVNWVYAYPIDVAKSKFQTAGNDKYQNTLKVFQDIVKVNGFSHFYKGFSLFIVGAFLADGVSIECFNCCFIIEFYLKFIYFS